MRYPPTRRNNAGVLAIFALLGLVTVVLLDDPCTVTQVFLAVTATQAWVFTVFYGLASTWRATAAARALFWIVFTYALVSTHVFVTGMRWVRTEWFADLRQFFYLGLAVAGMNLILTTTRLVLTGRDAP